MKIKNIAVGSYIQSKKDSKQLIAGHCYQVAEKDVSDKTVRLFSVDDSFNDSLWFCVSDFRKPRPQLKQLDQSIFDGLDEKWRFAAVGKNGSVYKFRFTPKVFRDSYLCDEGYHKCSLVGEGYDTSNWQNSLIERDIAKELTGSELCRAMIIGDRDWVLAYVSNESDAKNWNYADFVRCVNCHKYGYVELGIESCPSCKCTGCLMDIQESDIKESYGD